LAPDEETTMTRIRSHNSQRNAFTLVELLVVIAIIAVLVSLSAAGVMKVMGLVPEVQTRTDISQMDAALGAFMADYQLQDPPPSKLMLREDLAYNLNVTNPNYALELRSIQFLKRAFGKNLTAPIDWNGDGKADGPWILEGEQCLVFYLGGIPNNSAIMTGSPPACLGFSTNNNNPAGLSTSRKGPYFNFLSSRLVLGTVLNKNMSPFFVYYDNWKPTSGVQMPYAYFSSNGTINGYTLTDCATISAAPYRDAAGNYTNSNKYQIISAGQDGLFGNGLWNPTSGAVGTGRDDQANFSSKILGAGQQ
jgi:prepilin-type N-terminal cleavage/methylation domain-containing protein